VLAENISETFFTMTTLNYLLSWLPWTESFASYYRRRAVLAELTRQVESLFTELINQSPVTDPRVWQLCARVQGILSLDNDETARFLLAFARERIVEQRAAPSRWLILPFGKTNMVLALATTLAVIYESDRALSDTVSTYFIVRFREQRRSACELYLRDFLRVLTNGASGAGFGAAFSVPIVQRVEQLCRGGERAQFLDAIAGGKENPFLRCQDIVLALRAPCEVLVVAFRVVNDAVGVSATEEYVAALARERQRQIGEQERRTRLARAQAVIRSLLSMMSDCKTFAQYNEMLIRIRAHIDDAAFLEHFLMQHGDVIMGTVTYRPFVALQAPCRALSAAFMHVGDVDSARVANAFVAELIAQEARRVEAIRLEDNREIGDGAKR
jgi:hypothetical protein